MRKILLLALITCSCNQVEQERTPSDFKSKQQQSYYMTYVSYENQLHTLSNEIGRNDVKNAYKQWVTKFWKDTSKLKSWLLKATDIKENDTAAFFTLYDDVVQTSFVANTPKNSNLYHIIKGLRENGYVIASGEVIN